MRDIVATIQPDQDELVRADLDTSLCVQGAPGTGKTAVGLHRAAYLLYTYPERLRRTGVLVVGPNAAFLHYIAQVLPALGEGGIAQATVDELVARRVRRPRRATTGRVAVLKGDPRMADVLARAVRSHIAPPGGRRGRRHRHHAATGSARTTCAVTSTTRAASWRGAALERRRASGCGMQLAEDVRRQREDVGGAPTDAETAQVARSPRGPGVRSTRSGRRSPRRRCWPGSTPTPAFLARCAPMLDRRRAGRAAGRPSRPGSAAPRWTAADRVLLDELAGLLDGTDIYVPRRRRRGAGPVGHAVPRGGPALPARLDDRARRSGPGHHAVGAGLVAAPRWRIWASPRPRCGR